MSNEKQYPDDSIKDLVAYMLKLKNEMTPVVPKFRNSDLHERRSKYYETLFNLISELDALKKDNAGYIDANTQLVNDNERMKSDLADIHENLKSVVLDYYIIPIDDSFKIAAKYSEDK